MPMIDKTKATNAKMLKQKAKRDGNDYVTPEYLGNKIGVDTREKKEEEANTALGNRLSVGEAES